MESSICIDGRCTAEQGKERVQLGETHAYSEGGELASMTEGKGLRSRTMSLRNRKGEVGSACGRP